MSALAARLRPVRSLLPATLLPATLLFALLWSWGAPTAARANGVPTLVSLAYIDGLSN